MGCRCQRRPEASDALDLALQATLSHLMGVLGTELESPSKAESAFNHCDFLSSPKTNDLENVRVENKNPHSNDRCA